ncbi:exosome complex component MTR3 [Agrilus planipennis]|uniref:Exosome complex component MTR3 n=1 Tax=Agrilus planipennis TaxID=224129 RepID=A0A1W4X8D8_AGRPL|nr:exosome complex component MTR3 [Agrilus planipennis]
MPVDNRRITVPENTTCYNLFTKSKSFKNRCEHFINTSGKRPDGRKAEEHRKIFLQMNVVTQAKGSAYIEVGKTKVIVSVFDPRGIPNNSDYKQNGELYCEFKYAPFSCTKRRLHQQDSEEKQKSLIMKRSLESAVCRHEFPNFQVDIYALVLENDGSTLSAAITAAGIALAQAGIPMYDIITAAEFGYQDGTYVLDPTSQEERICSVTMQENNDSANEFKPQGIIILSMLLTHQQVSGFHANGNLRLSDVNNSFDVISRATADIANLVKKNLVKQVIKNVQENAIKK